MQSVFIGAFLLACLSFGIGQGYECSACASITTNASSLGECDEGNLPKITCYRNKTSCARATIAGIGPFSLGHGETPVVVAFNATVWGCVGIPIDYTCRNNYLARSDLLRGVSNRPGDYGISLPLFGNFLALLQSYETVLNVNMLCPCEGSICGESAGYGNNAGSLRTDVMIVLAFFLIAVFTKQS